MEERYVMEEKLAQLRWLREYKLEKIRMKTNRELIEDINNACQGLMALAECVDKGYVEVNPGSTITLLLLKLKSAVNELTSSIIK